MSGAALEDIENGIGLSEISTDDLRQLGAALGAGTLKAPLTRSSLGVSGFSHLEQAFRPYLGLERAALLAVLGATLAERRRSSVRKLDLVWSGSDAGPSYARYTKVVIPEMIASARRQITIAGYSFDRGAGIFADLHTAMTERRVAVRFFLDIQQLSQRLEQQLRKDGRHERLKPLAMAKADGASAFAREVLGLFRELHWPFPGAAPELWYDPRTADERSFASLHAKCLIVDFEQVLVTSANFTARGQERNIEAGILVHDKGYAEALERQWNNLIDSHDVVRST